jgi:hypothetical protein
MAKNKARCHVLFFFKSSLESFNLLKKCVNKSWKMKFHFILSGMAWPENDLRHYASFLLHKTIIFVGVGLQ